MILRPCQQEAVDEVYEHLRTKGATPCVVLPTGTGKSLRLAKNASDAVTLWGGRVLILAHVKGVAGAERRQGAETLPRIEGRRLFRRIELAGTRESVIVAASKACTILKIGKMIH